MATQKDKPRSVARRPSSPPADVASFVGGGVDAPEPSVGAKREKKVSTPLIIPPGLKKELEAHIERLGTGTSRSIWICEAIREKLDREGQGRG